MAGFSFLTIWSISIFCILPFRLGLRRSLIANSLLAAALTAVLALVIKSGIIPVK
jgi:hypothetical protein